MRSSMVKSREITEARVNQRGPLECRFVGPYLTMGAARFTRRSGRYL